MKMEAPLPGPAATDAPQRTWMIVTQVKSNRVVYFTDDPDYAPAMDGDWFYVSSHLGELPPKMTLRNCWRWRFNGVFSDTEPPAPAVPAGGRLVDHNRKALLQILNEKVDLARARHAPACIMGALAREEKLREARELMSGAKQDGYPFLEAVAVARNLSLAEAARLVLDKAAETRSALAESERLRETYARAILEAKTEEELLSLRRRLLDEVEPQLSARFAYALDRTEPFDPRQPLSKTHLTHEQTRLRVQLRERINAKRSVCVSRYALDDILLKHKGALAEKLLAASGRKVEGADYSLLESYARERGVPLLEAARDVLKELSEMGRVLEETEKLKDSLTAEIARIRTLDDVRGVADRIGQS